MGGIGYMHIIILEKLKFQYIVINYGEIMDFVGKKV
jgi:hypothetical protein